MLPASSLPSLTPLSSLRQDRTSTTRGRVRSAQPPAVAKAGAPRSTISRPLDTSPPPGTHVDAPGFMRAQT